MEQKIIFREMLSEIKALADQKGNRLTKEEIDQFFANAQLESAHLEMIYEYLISQKIQVVGYKGKEHNLFSDAIRKAAGDMDGEGNDIAGDATAVENNTTHRQMQQGSIAFRNQNAPQFGKQAQGNHSTEDDEWDDSDHPVSMELYLSEVSQLQQLDPVSELALFHQAVAGDDTAKRRLVELFLPMVCELAGDYEGDELPVEDLVQEGNIGLLLTMEQLEERDSLAAYQVQVMNAVNEHMQAVLGEHRDLRDLGDGIAQRVNHLSEAIHNLEEDLEHRVSVEELSAYLEMPAEEIRSILKMAGDELEVEEDE